MTIRRAGWDELFFATLLLAGLLTVGLPRPPAAGRLSIALSVATGALVGTALFRALAGSRARWPATARLRGLLGPRGVLLAARAAVEEVAWRGFLLGALAAPLGSVGALGATSAAFAFAHGNAHGRRRLVHVVIGGVLGGLYLASGRLASAVAAHVVYNALVVTAARADAS